MPNIKKNVEIISLVFKSIPYLHFIADQFKSDLCKVEGWDVGCRIVANDATDEVLEELPRVGVPYSVYSNPNPEEFYLNRVYGGYNYGVTSSKYDNVLLVNSDMVFSPGALSNLLKHHDGINIPCSRLVESGKMPTGRCGVGLGENHFGRHPNEFNSKAWEEWAEENNEDRVEPNGLFMPCLFEKKRIEEAGLYPRGNIFREGDKLVSGYPNDRPVFMTSDAFFFHQILERQYGMKHVTVFDSLVYHIQEGEKDE